MKAFSMGSITIKDVVRHLEFIAPPAYQESYDNSGLLTGDPADSVTGVLITLDCIESVVDEAIERGCNLVVAHHPIIFRGLKRLTGSNYVERTVIKAIRNHIAIYAIHTNLDNVHTGVNRKICEKIGLKNISVLLPKALVLSKLVTFVPTEHADTVLSALYAAGAGQIGNYDECSFSVDGRGTFRPNERAKPTIGERHIREVVAETRIEVIFPTHLQAKILRALREAHIYEEVAFYV
ncbi:MAG TPA: Nif3-like dinuclear metal center hexameric protein, partial [Chryseosolibacter sp.]|nr:Nif3-like dinuclear metal center hexameric protein [Chryseosolibacter sp.]